MHIACLPLTLLSLLPLYQCAHPQIHQQWPASSPVSTTTSPTLVDAISADPDYSTLLRLLQRARLIPTLNRLNGSTFFAPTNDAIDRHNARAESDSVWLIHGDGDELGVRDKNINEQLRQELLYHILNFTLSTPVENGQVQVTDTLHYPRKKIDPPTDEPPPGAPWVPLPGGTLGGAPQRLRVGGKEKDELWTGVNWKGDEGTKVIKTKDAGNGLLLGIGEVLDVPRDLAHIVNNHPRLSYLKGLIPDKMLDLLKETPELTLFLPVNDAWKTGLQEIDRLYLESEFAEDDLVKIVNMHAVWKNEVFWSEKLTDGSNVDTLFGTSLNFSSTGGDITVRNATLVETDIYASNGVLHIVDNLLIPPGIIVPTPEKYLLALNCTKFISLLHSVNLTHLVNTTVEEARTILAVPDDALSVLESPDLPEEGSEELKRMLEYHFLPKKWTPRKLKDGMLIETELREDGLDGGRQVLPIETSPSLLPDDMLSEEDAAQGLKFAGAGVVGKVFQINNTVIYQLNRVIEPPTDVLTAALPSLQLSSFIAAVFSTALDKLIKESPRTTVLIPRNTAFEEVGGLVSAHLLSNSPIAKADLTSVILHHVITEVQYEKDLFKGSQTTFKTLEGSDMHLERKKDDTLLLTPSGGWVGVKGELRPAKELLTRTGALYEISGLLIPRSVEITNTKLVKAAQGSTMASLVIKAGMGWILNGTAPPEDSEWAKEDLDGLGWTLLSPVDDAFTGLNITELKLEENEEALKALVYQHIIPTPRLSTSDDKAQERNLAAFESDVTHKPLPLDESTSYTTVQSRSSLYGDIVFVPPKSDGDQYLVHIKDLPQSQNKNATARVLQWGRCTTNGGAGGVMQIDGLLVPWQPTVWMKYGPPVAGGAGGVAVIALFFWLVRYIWRKDTTEPTYEPLNGYDGDSVSESTR